MLSEREFGYEGKGIEPGVYICRASHIPLPSAREFYDEKRKAYAHALTLHRTALPVPAGESLTTPLELNHPRCSSG